MSSASDISTLAKGCFGKVYKMLYNGQWAAVKKVPVELLSEKDLQREYKVYKEAVHPNIVRILGRIVVKDQKYIIPLEFIFGEDLETTIFHRDKSKIQVTPAVKFTIVSGMCEGLSFLHAKDIVHQDLKPDNIMVEHGTNRAVIIDMGLAKFFKNGINSARDRGNRAYSAPEILDECQRDQRSDVWAMGKIIGELRLMRRLQREETCRSKVRTLLEDSSYCSVVCSMVETNPANRLTMAEVVTEMAEFNLYTVEQVWMSCGHTFTRTALIHWCQRQLSEGKSQLECGVCAAQWSLKEVSEKARLSDQNKTSFESLMFKNYAVSELNTKFCPGCGSFILRKDPTRLCVRCPQCTRDRGAAYDFCWRCLQKWKGPTDLAGHCGNEGCVDVEF